MTPNFKDFKKLVKEKFKSLSNFSKIITGSFISYQGLQCLRNTDDNYWKIYALKKLAKKTDFDRRKVEISGFEIASIKVQMQFIIETTDHENAFQWLKANHISYSRYSGIINGRLKRKDLAFENLWKKLEL